MSGSQRSLVRRLAGYCAQALVAVFLVGAMAAGIATLHWRADAKVSADATPPLPVATMTIALKEGYRVEQRFAGRLEPRRETPVAFERSGLVTDVLVEEGDPVVEGQVIAVLDQDQLRARRAGLVADRQRAEAELELARLTTERQADLSDKGFASTQRFDEARLNAKALEAAIASIDAALLAVDIDIAKSEIKAPFDAIVADRFLDQGRIVSAGVPVVRLMEAGGAQVRIGIAPEAAQGLEPGIVMPLTAGDRQLDAKLISLRPDLTMATRTVPALLIVEDVQGLAFGDMVELAIGRDVSTEGTWVPLAALSEAQNGLWSLMTTAEDADAMVARREAVEILHVEGEQAFVRGSFLEGDQIIVGGDNRLVAGQRITVLGQG
ncbi:MAG: efflux RND transporter periplasmic adaptor subunit [Pseudomonadota bacterium]